MPRKPSHPLTHINEHARTATCAVCGPVAIVRRHKRADGSYAWRCGTQNAVNYKRWIEDHPEKKHRPKNERNHRRSEHFARLYQQQRGRCAVCGTTPPSTALLRVDHDHETGVVRGLLCNHCNLGIGHLCDDPALLRRAAAYIEKYLPS